MVRKLFGGKKLNKRSMELIIIILAIFVLLIIVFLLMIVNQAENRDIERISSINKLREALQLYYLDKNYYPTQFQWCSLEINCNNLSTEIKPYLKEMPKDPFYPKEKNGKIYSYQYKTTADGREYKIYANLEKGKPYELNSKGGFSISLPNQ